MKQILKPATPAVKRAAVVALLLALAACSSSPPLRFYSLATPPMSGSGSVAAAPASSAGLFIDVLAVGVPERLARPQLVVRKGDDGRMDVLEQDRWTAPFNNELRDTLADGLAVRLGAIDARRGGRQSGQPLYRIAVNVRQFDAISGERVDAAFGWTVTRVDGGDGKDKGSSASCQASYSVPASGGTAALVAAMQKTVAMATDGIAATVNGLRNGVASGCG